MTEKVTQTDTSTSNSNKNNNTTTITTTDDTTKNNGTTTTTTTKIIRNKDLMNRRPPNIEPKPTLTKAERREIQERQRAEKAARASGGTSSTANTKQVIQTAVSNSNASGSKQQQQQQQQPKAKPPVSSNQQQQQQQQTAITTITNTEKIDKKLITNKNSTVVVVSENTKTKTSSSSSSLVSHLPLYNEPYTLFKVGATIESTTTGSTNSADRSSSLHPLIVQTGYWYSTRQIRGSNERCRAMLRCYLHLINDFMPSSSSSSSLLSSASKNKSNTNNNNNNNTTTLRSVIEQNILKIPFQYWTEYCRPHSVSMGNAYTFLKSAIATIELSSSSSSTTTTTTTSDSSRTNQESIDNNWTTISTTLINIIQAYERERIDLPIIAIAEITYSKVLFPTNIIMSRNNTNNNNTSTHGMMVRSNRRTIEGDVFLTYGDSESVRAVFQYAAKQKQHKFRVIVVDSYPFYDGKKMINYLSTVCNISNCTYCTISSIEYVLQNVTKVILGACALSSNDGSIVGRAGISIITIAAATKHIPVIICCETYKISNRLFMGSINNNEIHSNNNVNNNNNTTDDTSTSTTNNTTNYADTVHQLNLLYDLTPAKFISGIVTELGLLPPTSIAVLVREMNLQQDN